MPGINEGHAQAVLQMAGRRQAWAALTHLASAGSPMPASRLAPVMNTSTAAAQVLLLQMYRVGLIGREPGPVLHGSAGRRPFVYRVDPGVAAWLTQTREMASSRGAS